MFILMTFCFFAHLISIRNANMLYKIIGRKSPVKGGMTHPSPNLTDRLQYTNGKK